MIPRSRWIFKRGKLMPHIVEEDVVEEVTTRLWWQYKIKVWRVRERIPGAGALSIAGIPDLIGWLAPDRPTGPGSTPLNARPLFIEVKRPGGARRPAQIQFIAAARSDGCVAFFAESWEQCVEELNSYGIQLKAA